MEGSSLTNAPEQKHLVPPPQNTDSSDGSSMDPSTVISSYSQMPQDAVDMATSLRGEMLGHYRFYNGTR